MATATIPSEDFKQLVQAFVRRLMPDALLGSLRRLSGGAMQQSWAMEVERGATVERYVLRRGRPGMPRHPLDAGFDIEAATIHAAGSAGTPVPQVAGILTPSDGLGEGFLSVHVDGETIARIIQRDAMFANVRECFATECGQVLAHIHNTPTNSLPMMRVAGIGAMLSMLRHAIDIDPTPRPVFAYALRWLEENAPQEPEALSLVHGDFRLGNLIMDGTSIRAVLDWEQTHVGDPIEDLAWLCLPPWRFGQVDRPVGGIGSIDDLVAAYREAGGTVAIDRLHWWSVASSLRWGVHCAEMLSAFRGDDATVERGMIARRISENEIDMLTTIAGGPDYV